MCVEDAMFWFVSDLYGLVRCENPEFLEFPELPSDSKTSCNFLWLLSPPSAVSRKTEGLFCREAFPLFSETMVGTVSNDFCQSIVNQEKKQHFYSSYCSFESQTFRLWCIVANKAAATVDWMWSDRWEESVDMTQRTWKDRFRRFGQDHAFHVESRICYCTNDKEKVTSACSTRFTYWPTGRIKPLVCILYSTASLHNCTIVTKRNTWLLQSFVIC
jgi:hypothetical protein